MTASLKGMNALKKQNVTFSYAVITAFFWMTFCIAIAYTADYLQNMGFSDTEVGLIMAAGNLSGACIAPVLGGLCDRKRNLTTFSFFAPLTILKAVCLTVLLISGGRGIVTAVAYGAYIAFSIPVNTLNLKICIDYERAGCPLNYGLARGCGSLGFVLISSLLGVTIEKIGYATLPVAGLLLLIPESVMQAATDRRIRALRNEMNEDMQTAPLEKSSSMIGFIRENKRFTVFLLGSFLIFYTHNIDTNFLINLTRSVGGGSQEMGFISSFTAVCELPALMLFSRFLSRYRTDRLMRISLVMFVVKTAAYTFAPTVPVLFVSRLLQCPSYALYTAATVPYVKSVINDKDAARGQSLAFTMTTAGSVAASVIGGRLYDLYSVRTVMLIALAVCAVGVLIAVAGTENKKTPSPAKL